MRADPGRRWRRSALGRTWRQGTEVELLQRSMGFAALGLVTLMPLLVVVAAVAPGQRTGFAQWVVDGMGLGPHPSQAVRRLFATPRNVLSATSALSLASLAVFGLSFAAAVETGYRKTWELPPSPWHGRWRHAVWLAGLTGYLFVEAQSGTVLHHGWRPSTVRIALTLLSGFCFFWWGQRFLLGDRLRWRAAAPGAAFTMLGLVGLRGFSSLVFSPLIVSNAVTYGAVGTVLIVQCWLIGVGFVVFGGPLLGRHAYEAYARRDPSRPRPIRADAVTEVAVPSAATVADDPVTGPAVTREARDADAAAATPADRGAPGGAAGP